MRRLVSILGAAAFTLAALGSSSPASAQAVDSLFTTHDARAIGPSGTSGRIAAVAAVGSRPDVIFVGAATGGVWKSEDAGLTWRPVFDDQNASSIGAIAIHPEQPDVVWVGTGEANVRNSMGHGRGVWRSVDGGESWTFVGLEASERISRILVHPDDPETAYVAALGPAWSSGGERGVYKTTDGGESWEQVLYVDENTGAAEIAMDPANPDHILAAMWEYRRWPWFFESGGEGSGLHVTFDGGRTWTKQGTDEGLPAGELGRIGLAFATHEPSVVYALVEAETSQLLRSDDGGRSWEVANGGPGASPRPFYYSRIYVDPTNENRIYRLHTNIDRSDDGGATWYQVGNNPSTVHLDHHAFWIDPADGKMLITGNDGGVYLSYNRGETWRFVENLPLSQFYHVYVDQETPYNVYGGLQDNGSWRGPSQVWAQPGFTGSVIQSHDWRTVGFGDGFVAAPDPEDATKGYHSSQGGNLQRWDLATNEWKAIRPPDPDSVEMRYNWNAGFAQDPHDAATIYYGSQFLMRSTDRGQTWETLSPDLTTNDPEKQNQVETGGLTYDDSGAENHTTILTIAPSPLERPTIWVGTDDGNVQLTRDDGTTWTNFGPELPGTTPGHWVPHIEASKHEASRAYVVVNDHRRGDWTSFLFRTDDYGGSWTNLATDDLDGPVHIVEEDPVDPDLLWAGTEFGLFLSRDGGGSWAKWTHGFPTVPVRDILTHPRDHDLVVGTHGRGAYVIDDIRPIRTLTASPELADSALVVFPIADAYQHNRGLTGPFYFPGHTEFQGENRPAGALVHYRVDELTEGDSVRIEVLDGSGNVVRRVHGEESEGMHRWIWNFTRDGYWGMGAPSADSIRPSGLPVMPGTYTVRISTSERSGEASVRVMADPRAPVPQAERSARYAAMDEAMRIQQRLGVVLRRLNATASSLGTVGERVGGMDEGEGRDALQERVDSATASVDALRDRIRPGGPPIQGFRRSSTIQNLVGQAMGRIGSSSSALTEGDRVALERARAAVGEIEAEVEALYDGEIAELQEALREAGVTPLDAGG